MVRCPNCGKKVGWTAANRFKPFCSERCRLIDLGDWMSESHRIPGDPAIDEDTPSAEE